MKKVYICPICGSIKIDSFTIDGVIVCRKCNKPIIPLASPQKA